MVKKIVIGITGVVVVIVGMFFFLNSGNSDKGAACDISNEVNSCVNDNKAVVYKSSNCGCCAIYASYLEGKGFDVSVVDIQDVSSIRRGYNIPVGMGSCHTSVIGDYFIEGHVPIKVIEKLLEEKPEVDGIALPGMPSGSPGMPGSKLEKFKIYSLSNGVPSEFMVM